MEQGDFDGYHEGIGAVLVMTPSDGLRGKSVHRMGLDFFWNTDDLDKLCGFPWDLTSCRCRTAKPSTMDESPPLVVLPSMEVEQCEKR